MTERFTVHLNDLEEAISGTQDGDVFSLKGMTLEECAALYLTQFVGRFAVANGCFDGLHPGHLNILATLDTEAYKRRLRPIVALNSDRSVRRIKGNKRPIYPQDARALLINSLKWPLTVVLFDEETPERLMSLLRPSLVIKGSEYDPVDVVRPQGAEVYSVPMLGSWSTSRLMGDTR